MSKRVLLAVFLLGYSSISTASDPAGLVSLFYPYIIVFVAVGLVLVLFCRWILSKYIKDKELRIAVRVLFFPASIALSSLYFGPHFVLIAPFFIGFMGVVIWASFSGSENGQNS